VEFFSVRFSRLTCAAALSVACLSVAAAASAQSSDIAVTITNGTVTIAPGAQTA